MIVTPRGDHLSNVIFQLTPRDDRKFLTKGAAVRARTSNVSHTKAKRKRLEHQPAGRPNTALVI